MHWHVVEDDLLIERATMSLVIELFLVSFKATVASVEMQC